MSRIFSEEEKQLLIKHGFDYSKIPIPPDMPVEYVVGWAPFYGRDFMVNQQVLIPRDETEVLVTCAIEQITRLHIKDQPLHIIDVGTGSGIIGITLFLELQTHHSNLYVTLTDISTDAVAVAKENINYLVPDELHEQISVVQSDLLHESAKHNEAIDVIVANLPYIPTSRLKELPQAVVDYEPQLALDGGHNGFEIINNLLQQVDEIHHVPALIILEIDSTFTIDLFYRIPEYQYEIIPDQFGHPRFLLLTYFDRAE